MPPYRLTDHTADLGMEFSALSLAALFSAAGEGLFDIITDVEKVRRTSAMTIEVLGADAEDLMVNWLRELLYLHQVKGMLFRSFDIEQIGETTLTAKVSGEPFDPALHKIRKEIKAATYHDLKVEEKNGAWTATVVFDV